MTETSGNRGGYTYQPDAEEEKLWSWLDNSARQAATIRDEDARFSEFSDFLDIFYGKHWPTSMPTFRPPIVVNELRTLLLAEASDLTENQPRIYVTRSAQSKGRDELLERAFRAVWARNFVDIELLYSALWGLVVGTGFMDIGWDTDMNGGRGDVLIESRDPRTVLPDPDALNDRKWLFVIKETVMDLQEIQRLFPIKGGHVESEDRYSFHNQPRSSSPEGPTMSEYHGPLYEHGSSTEQGMGYKKGRARVLDCIVKDPAVERVVEEMKKPDGSTVVDEKGNPKFKISMLAKYPKGRRIVGSNGVILLDGPNTNFGGDFGTVRIILEPTLGRFWGAGFVEQTSQLQLSANKMMSSLVENALRLNNGMIIATGNTGIDWESFSSMPGQILQINQNSSLKVEYPQSMPDSMIKAPWQMLDLQRRLLGFSEGRLGTPGKGNVSSDLVETEVSNSQSTTRLRARMLYHSVQRMAEMIFARMAFGYSTKRSIPSVEGEKFSPVEWEPLDKPEDYSVYVDPASFSVMSRTMLKRLATVLYKLKAIDRKSMLEAVNWPDWEQVSQRLDKQEMMAALAKAKSGGRGKK